MIEKSAGKNTNRIWLFRRPSCGRGASQFLARLFFSLAPGFSRVNRARRKWKRFQPFSAPAATKPLKRLGAASPAPTGLKPGANERLQESEMRLTALSSFLSPCTSGQPMVLSSSSSNCPTQSCLTDEKYFSSPARTPLAFTFYLPRCQWPGTHHRVHGFQFSYAGG